MSKVQEKSHQQDQVSGKRRTPQVVTPHIVCADAAKAIEFYKKAFGATELMRLPGPDGKIMHASIEVYGGMIMMVDESPLWGSFSPLSLKGSPVTIHLNVPDVDAVVERAAAAGVKVVMPVADMFWGDRYGVIEDPFGHKWSIATHQRDMTAEEIQKAMAEFKFTSPECAGNKAEPEKATAEVSQFKPRKPKK